MPEQNPTERNTDQTSEEAYQAPAIEEVITPASIEREVHYAGIVAPSQIVN